MDFWVGMGLRACSPSFILGSHADLVRAAIVSVNNTYIGPVVSRRYFFFGVIHTLWLL